MTTDLTPAEQNLADHLRDESTGILTGGPDELAGIVREAIEIMRQAIEAEVRREFVQFHDPAHCHYCAGWDYSPPCPYVAAGARAESECTVTPGQEEEIRADERTKVLAEYRAEVEAEVRERVTREIKDMKHDLGDEGWAELERRATDADWPVEWVRRRRTGNEFTTAVIETAYQVGRDRAADTAQGGGSGE